MSKVLYKAWSVISRFLPEIVIVFLALLPVLFTWGRLAIGGDVLIPFTSQGLQKYLYQWIELRNGQYFAVNYFPFFFIYKIGESLSLSVPGISAVLLFSLNLIGGFGIYRLSRLVARKSEVRIFLVPIVFYLFSPALLNAFHYAFIYMFAPWFIYFIFKAAKFKKLSIGDAVWIQVVLAFCSFDLPNPKYVFHLFFIAAITFIVSALLRLVTWKQFGKIVGMFFVSCLVSSYFLLPLMNFAVNYTPEDYGVRVKAGYQDTGVMMNHGTDTLDRVFKLHIDSLFLNYRDADKYNHNIGITILSYSFIGIALLYLFRVNAEDGYDRRREVVIWVLFLLYLFFAAGPNPPFGDVYEFLVTKSALLAFLRTTAGAVFFLSIFYALLLMLFVQESRKFKSLIFVGVLLGTLIVGYPYWTGKYFKNFNAINQFTDIEKRGFIIPREYYAAQSFIDYQKINARWFYPNSNLTYLNTTWGFFGPVIYNFLYNNYNIGYDKIFGNFSNHNVGFVFVDQSLMDELFFGVKNTVKAWEDNFLKIAYIDKESFLPKMYTARTIGDFNATPLENAKRDLLNSSNDTRAVSFLGNNEPHEYSPVVDQNVILEYRMINPTKYRVRVHGAFTSMVLVLSEQYHKDWRVYLSSVDHKPGVDALSQAAERDYKILDKNEYFSATKSDLMDYIKQGSITTLGEGSEKKIEHYSWDGNKQKLESIEKYHIDFISKNFQGTIQNDNLFKGSFRETWFDKNIAQENHFPVNGYANAWMMNADTICTGNDQCTKNSDGSYDFELVVEFFPQQVFYVSAIISGMVCAVLALLYGLGWRTRRKSHTHLDTYVS